MGKPEGVCGGFGGSQHLHKNRFYSNGILGGMPPVAVGMALAEKLKGSGAISVVFMGDGSMGEGNIYEAFNMSSLWNIPILFVVEHNQYAQSTHYSLEHAGVLSQRPNPFGIKSTVINGNDVSGVEKISRQLIREIRIDSRPQLLFLETYRIAPHSKGDDLRDPLEIEKGRSNDPLTNLLSNSEGVDWKEGVEKEVNERILKLLKKLEVAL
jgi:TPP-dependent pyruvate/acetoin dehydrogenase alpha subunit